MPNWEPTNIGPNAFSHYLEVVINPNYNVHAILLMLVDLNKIGVTTSPRMQCILKNITIYHIQI